MLIFSSSFEPHSQLCPRSLCGPVDVKDAVKTNVPFEVNKCAAAEIKGFLQNGSEETIKRVVDEEIAQIDKKSVHSETYVYLP
jgi:hypothetical protein